MRTKKAETLFILIFCLSLWNFGDFLSLQMNPIEIRRASQFSLSNGLNVVYQYNPVSEVTVMLFLIRGGKMAEPQGKEGLANMTTRLSLEIPDRTTLQKIMTQATQINMTSSMDYSFLSIASLSEHFDGTINLLSEILLKPLFSSIRIDNIKKAMNRSREFQQENPLQLAHDKALEVFYGGTAYSGSIYGQEDTLKSIKKRDVDDFYDIHFTVKNTAIFVSSDLGESTIQKILEEHFKELPEGTAIEDTGPIQALFPEEKSIFVEKETQQNLILFAFPLPEVSEENYVLSTLLDSFIGKGVNSVLWPLRVKEKLAYNVSSRLSLNKEGGLFEVYLETEKGKMDAAREALQGILDNLIEDGVSEKVHTANLAYYKGSFLREMETKRDRTFSLLSLEALGLGYSFLDRIFQEVENTTLEEMNAFIKDVLSPDKRIEIIIGQK
ncbi:MAG: insulinase family protein [Candidatus Aminicenantes bacterium]|nr:insulinase family protein [Candidatus Aminicenantes bacterium]